MVKIEELVHLIESSNTRKHTLLRFSEVQGIVDKAREALPELQAVLKIVRAILGSTDNNMEELEESYDDLRKTVAHIREFVEKEKEETLDEAAGGAE